MDETVLKLKNGVKLTEKDGKIGLTIHGRTQFAKNAQQSEILRELVRQSQAPESLVALLRERNDLQNDNHISLAIAEFILDFGEYLEV